MRRLTLTSEQWSSLLDVILIFCSLKLKFGPVIPTPPYSEGEFYTVLERNVSIQVRPEWVMNNILLHPLLLDAEMLTLVVLELLYLSSGELESGIDIISTCLSQTLPTSHHNIVSSQGILTIDFLLISATCRPRCQPRPWLPSPTTPPTWPTWRQPTDRLSKIDAPRGISVTNISFCIATLCQHSEQIKKKWIIFIPDPALSLLFLQIYFQTELFHRRRRKTEELPQQTCGLSEIHDLHYCSLRRGVQEIVGKLEINISWFYQP